MLYLRPLWSFLPQFVFRTYTGSSQLIQQADKRFRNISRISTSAAKRFERVNVSFAFSRVNSLRSYRHCVISNSERANCESKRYEMVGQTNGVSKPKVIDFRSDTFSLPTREMRSAMFTADVGDAVYNEDPTKIALEKKAAEIFEREDAVFVTSGTMANLVAILVHCRKRPCEIIVGSKSHIILFEQVGAAQFGGVNIREVENNPDGTFNITEVKDKIRTNEFYEPRTSLVCVENTHNMLCGQIVPLEWLDKLGTKLLYTSRMVQYFMYRARYFGVCTNWVVHFANGTKMPVPFPICTISGSLVDFAKSENLSLHMDGARIFNAAVKLKLPVSRITRGFDSINVCLSKSLGCPYGSVLVGSKSFITQARNVVKALGGGSRQIGFMAAAGIYALDNMIERLQDDHDHIQMIANTIREMNHPYIKVPPAEKIHTNILNIYFDGAKILANDFLTKLETVSKDGPNVIIRALSIIGNSIRLVACCNVTKCDMPEVIKKIRSVINEFK